MSTTPTCQAGGSIAKDIGIKRVLPFLDWLVNYRRVDLTGDLLMGIIVAILRGAGVQRHLTAIKSPC